MTDDKELIARLRSMHWCVTTEANGVGVSDSKVALAAADRIEALTKERDAARQDAKAAEDELELQEQEACMMENDYIKLEKERDALQSALGRIRSVPERILRGVPVCDLAETLAEADSALNKGESHE